MPSADPYHGTGVGYYTIREPSNSLAE